MILAVAKLFDNYFSLAHNVTFCTNFLHTVTMFFYIFQTDVETQNIEGAQKDFSMEVAIEMPFDIRKVICPTHKVKLKVSKFKLAYFMWFNDLSLFE